MVPVPTQGDGARKKANLPFDTGTLVIVKKTKEPGKITQAIGRKKWIVELEGGIMEKEFSSQQLRHPKEGETGYGATEFQDSATSNMTQSDESDAQDDPAGAHDNEQTGGTCSSQSNNVPDINSDLFVNDDDEDEDVQWDNDIDASSEQEVVDEDDIDPDTEMVAEDEEEVAAEPATGEDIEPEEANFASTLEPEDVHQRRLHSYRTQKQQLLDEGWKVEMSRKAKKLGPGVAAEERHGQKRTCTILDGENGKWTIQFLDGSTETDVPSSRLKQSSNADAKYIWKLVEDSIPEPGLEPTEFKQIGFAGFDFKEFKSTKLDWTQGEYNFPYLRLLQAMWPGDWREQLLNLNKYISSTNPDRAKGKRYALVSDNEWWKFIGVLVSAAAAGKGGENLFESKQRLHGTFSEQIDLGINGRQVMSHNRYKQIRSVWRYAFQDEDFKDTDSYYPIRKLIEGLNQVRHNYMASSSTLILDEIMSAFVPRTTKKSSLPNLSHILRKPKPLGIEFKAVCCAKTGVLLYVEVQRGKDEMCKQKYSQELGSTAGCTLRLVENSLYSGEKLPERAEAKEKKRVYRTYQDAWFGSVTQVEQQKISIQDADGNPVGPESISAIKSNHTLFPKEELEKKMEEYPSGSYLVLECKTPIHKVDLVAIGYKYNARKILCFLMTKNAGSTKPGRPYIARFPDRFGNVKSRTVTRPQAISDFFRHSNAVDRHNHARQSLLKLEKHWITHDPWFRLSTSFVGFAVTDCWLATIFQSDDPAMRSMKVVDFADRLTYDLLNNNCSRIAGSVQHDMTHLVVPRDSVQPVAEYNGFIVNDLTEQMQALMVRVESLSNPQQSMVSHFPTISGSVGGGAGRQSDVSSITNTTAIGTGQQHALAKFKNKRRCRYCHAQTKWHCIHPSCEAVVNNVRGDNFTGSFFCQVVRSDKGENISCFQKHLDQVHS